MRKTALVLILALALGFADAISADSLTVLLRMPSEAVEGGEFCLDVLFLTNPGILGCALMIESDGLEVLGVESVMRFETTWEERGGQVLIILDSVSAIGETGTAVRIRCRAYCDASPRIYSADPNGAWTGSGNVEVDIASIGTNRVSVLSGDYPVLADERIVGEGDWCELDEIFVCGEYCKCGVHIIWDNEVFDEVSAAESFGGIDAEDFGGYILLIVRVKFIPVSETAELTVISGNEARKITVCEGSIWK